MGFGRENGAKHVNPCRVCRCEELERVCILASPSLLRHPERLGMPRCGSHRIVGRFLSLMNFTSEVALRNGFQHHGGEIVRWDFRFTRRPIYVGCEDLLVMEQVLVRDVEQPTDYRGGTTARQCVGCSTSRTNAFRGSRGLSMAPGATKSVG